MLSEMTVRELYELTLEGTPMEKDQVEYVTLQGWIRTTVPERMSALWH